MYGLPNSLGYSRLGLTVTRKVGPAVIRNRVKRRLREAYRRNRVRLGAGLDLVVNGRAAALDRPAPELERDLLQCFERIVRGASR